MSNILIRSSDASQKICAQLHRFGDSVKITYDGEKGQQGLISKFFEKTRTHSEAIFTAPSHAELNYYDQDGLSLKIKISLTLCKKNSYRAHIFFYLKDNFLAKIKYYLGYPFFYLALQQDLRILQAQYKNKITYQQSYTVNEDSDIIRSHLYDLLVNKDFSKDIKRLFHLYV